MVRYTGKSMKDAHASLALNDTHFNIGKDHFLQAMKDCSKDPLSISQVGDIVEGFRNDIVTVKVSLFERIGGEQFLRKAVERTYAKALADPQIKGYFTNVDMNR